MPEEAIEAPVEEQDTPDVTEPEAPEAPETPEADTPSEPEVDYRQRYESLRPEFDRTNQVLAALQGRHGTEAQAEAARMFGFELEEEDVEDDADSDPDERLTRLEQELRERDQRAEERELELAEKDWIQTEHGKIEDEFGRELMPEEKEIIDSFATSHRFENGQPDMEGGKKRLLAIYSGHQKRLTSSKRSTSKPPEGAKGDETIDTSTLAARRKAITDIAAEHQAASD